MTQRANITALPSVSAHDPAWLQECERFAAQHQEFRLTHVVTTAQVQQAVNFLVHHHLWIEECEGGFVVALF